MRKTKTYYVISYSIGNGTWLLFSSERYASQAEAEAFAQKSANEEIETRVSKVISEVVSHYPKVAGKKRTPVVLHGLGVISEGGR